MASIDFNQLTDGAAHPAIGPVQPEVSDLVGIARRGWLYIVAGTIFGLVCALVVIPAGLRVWLSRRGAPERPSLRREDGPH